jgi:PAS domain S-box-containing protein
MKRFRNQPIRTKLVVIIMTASIIAIISGLVIYLIFDMNSIKNEMKRNADLNASLVGQYSVGPLIFDYKDEAKDVLTKLNTMPSVLDACIYDANGEIFSFYHKTTDNIYKFPKTDDKKTGFSDGYLHVYYNIIYEGKNFGTLYLRLSTETIKEKLRNNLLVIFLLILTLVIPVYLIAFRLQKFISKPILNLAELAKTISQNQDYSVQLKPYGNDEIGILYRQFNDFLSQILKRQKERDLAEEKLNALNEQLRNELVERSQIEGSLRLSEERYRYLFERNPAPMAIYDPVSLDLLAGNEAFFNLYGYLPEDVPLLHLPDFYPDYEKKLIVDLVRGLKGHRYTGEWHHVKKDGSIFPIITTSHDLVYMGKKARVVVITDITERKKAEEEVLLLAQVVKNINEFVSITDLEDNIIFVNQAWLKTFGYSENEVSGEKIRMIVSSNNPPELIAEILPATLKGGWKGEVLNIKKDGTEFPVMLFTTIIYNNNNEPIALAGISSDITERKRIEKELIKHHYHLEELVTERTNELKKYMDETSDLYDNAPCGYHSVDSDGKIIRINNTELAWLGYTREEVVGKMNIKDLLSPASAAILNERFSDFKNQGKVVDREYEYMRKDGSTFIVALNSNAIYDSEGNYIMDRATIFDITDRKHSAEALSKAMEAAENANKTKSEFLANMSHEIRTPMNAVLGYTELLSSLLTNQTQKNYIESIKSSGRSLLTLINDILDLSKIEAGKLELEYDFVDSNFFFKEFERIFALKASEKGIKFIVEIQSGTPAGIYIDEPRLRQIIFNLIGNAIKFTTQGYVKLIVHTDNIQVVHYNAEKSEEFLDLWIDVEDTGIGISREIMEEIFDPFIQARDQKNIGGTGLGLAITRRLTHLMKGKISLKSELGKGSTFSVKIPEIAFKREFVNTKTTIQINPSEIIFESATILVVDDVEYNRNYIRDTLNNTNLTVIDADEGFKAFELAKKVIPQLIISDIRMPNMDGFELLNRLKTNKKLRNIPVLAYSASVLKDQKERVHKSKFAGLLTKPVNISELYIELMNHLPYKEAKSEKAIPPVTENSESSIIKINDLIETLESDLMQTWNSFEVTQPIDEVTNFGENLISVGTNHNSSLIVNYGKELQTAADNFDIEAILMLLKKYKSIIEKLKELK